MTMDCFSECDLIGNYLLFWLPSTSTEISRGKMYYLVAFRITKASNLLFKFEKTHHLFQLIYHKTSL